MISNTVLNSFSRCRWGYSNPRPCITLAMKLISFFVQKKGETLQNSSISWYKLWCVNLKRLSMICLSDNIFFHRTRLCSRRICWHHVASRTSESLWVAWKIQDWVWRKLRLNQVISVGTLYFHSRMNIRCLSALLCRLRLLWITLFLQLFIMQLPELAIMRSNSLSLSKLLEISLVFCNVVGLWTQSFPSSFRT